MVGYPVRNQVYSISPPEVSMRLPAALQRYLVFGPICPGKAHGRLAMVLEAFLPALPGASVRSSLYNPVFSIPLIAEYFQHFFQTTEKTRINFHGNSEKMRPAIPVCPGKKRKTLEEQGFFAMVATGLEPVTPSM